MQTKYVGDMLNHLTDRTHLTYVRCVLSVRFYGMVYDRHVSVAYLLFVDVLKSHCLMLCFVIMIA